ncbi:helix-turn-helix domain-containing protein [Salinarimonas ramus]|uniref:helix-turn-helix domain-containing protein n=1 Tax=Salinarimonas ramus TaxID=690164 RepID=UPI001FCE82F7|nr:helix-turn-helix transcriptional regulator [Salinarimonas ramus]
MRAARNARGWSQALLAEKAGMAVNSVGRMERGEMGLSFKRIDAVANALDVEPAALFAVEPPVTPTPEKARLLHRIQVLLHRMSEEELLRLMRVVKAVET